MTITLAEDTTTAAGRLTLRGIRVFIALEEIGSIAGTARSLGLSKSNVSQQVSALETSVGAKLFDRTQKPISLTPAGQVLSVHAHRILATVSVAETSLAELSLSSLPVLNFAIIDDLDASITPELAASMQAQMPRCFINTFSGRSDQVNERFLAREADIAVTATLPDSLQSFQVQQLAREQFVLVTAKDLYQAEEDWRAQLSTMPFVQYADAMPMGRQISTHLKRIGFQVPRRFSFEATRSVLATVAKTGGWTLSTPLAVLDADRFHDAIDIFPLPFAGLSRHIYMVNRKDELGTLPNALAKKFRVLLNDVQLDKFVKLAPSQTNALTIASDGPSSPD
ncbi:MAG: LysR family transcriptional regulator [Pseudomonadota bacterium]